MHKKITTLLLAFLIILVGTSEAVTLTQILGERNIKTEVSSGQDVILRFTAESKYDFESWEVISPTNVDISDLTEQDPSNATITIKMPNKDISVRANYKVLGEQEKTIPTLVSGNKWYGSTDISKITKIIIKSDPYTEDYDGNPWSADSEAPYGDIMCYKNGTTLIMSGNGTGSIKANSNSGSMFANFKNLVSIDGLNVLDTSNVTNMYGMFLNCEKLGNIYLSQWDTKNVTNMSHIFAHCAELKTLTFGDNFSTSNVTDMSGMFYDCVSLTGLNVSKFDTSKVTTMWGMFNDCRSLTSLSVSNFNTANVTNMSNMFDQCKGLTTLNISNFNTSKVTDMGSMFSLCNNLTTLKLGDNFSTANVKSMRHMFLNDSSLTNLDVSDFNTSKVTDMTNMFSGCSSLASLELTNFDTSSVKYEIISTDDGNVTTGISGMFSGMTKLQQIKLGNKFSFKDKDNVTSCVLPTPDSKYISGSTGYWYDENGEQYLPKDVPSNVANTYTALPTVINYTLTYNANGGTGAPNIEKGTNLVISATVPTRSGYNFLGWAESNTATIATYTTGQTIKLTKDVTLYAVWQLKNNGTAKLAYDKNTTDTVTSMPTTPLTQALTGTTTSHTFTISSNTPRRSGYTFLGWSKNSTATTASYTARKTISVGNETITLYAVWEIDKYECLCCGELITINDDCKNCSETICSYDGCYRCSNHNNGQEFCGNCDKCTLHCWCEDCACAIYDCTGVTDDGDYCYSCSQNICNECSLCTIHQGCNGHEPEPEPEPEPEQTSCGAGVLGCESGACPTCKVPCNVHSTHEKCGEGVECCTSGSCPTCKVLCDVHSTHEKCGEGVECCTSEACQNCGVPCNTHSTHKTCNAEHECCTTVHVWCYCCDKWDCTECSDTICSYEGCNTCSNHGNFCGTCQACEVHNCLCGWADCACKEYGCSGLTNSGPHCSSCSGSICPTENCGVCTLHEECKKCNAGEHGCDIVHKFDCACNDCEVEVDNKGDYCGDQGSYCADYPVCRICGICEAHTAMAYDAEGPICENCYNAKQGNGGVIINECACDGCSGTPYEREESMYCLACYGRENCDDCGICDSCDSSVADRPDLDDVDEGMPVLCSNCYSKY